jgi:hypothetical protein
MLLRIDAESPMMAMPAVRLNSGFLKATACIAHNAEHPPRSCHYRRDHRHSWPENSQHTLCAGSISVDSNSVLTCRRMPEKRV